MSVQHHAALITYLTGRTVKVKLTRVSKAFDHIFTDQELYEEYNLTDEEINIIESVIKERK